MSFRSTSTLTALSAALVTALAAGAASAQQPDPSTSPPQGSTGDPAATPATPPAATPAQPPAAPAAAPAPAPEKKDKARFRGGIALTGGVMVVPDIINLGLAGLQGELGVQINNSFGAYLVPNFHIVLGDFYGLQIGTAAVFDYTLLDGLMSVGAGPEVAGFVAFGVPNGIGINAAAGSLYGARIHFAVHPAMGIGDNGIRRKAFSIGVDLRLLGGGAGFVKDSTGGVGAKVADFVFEPTLSLGYTAF